MFSPNEIATKHFNETLRKFTRNPEALRERGWDYRPAAQLLTPGGYWVSKAGHVFKVPGTHIDSILDLPEEVFSAFEIIPFSSGFLDDGGTKIRERFILASGYLRFRIHHSELSPQSFGYYIDVTTPPSPTYHQDVALTRLHRIKRTYVRVYGLDPSGRSAIRDMELEAPPDDVLSREIMEGAFAEEARRQYAHTVGKILRATGGTEGMALRYRLRGGD